MQKAAFCYITDAPEGTAETCFLFGGDNMNGYKTVIISLLNFLHIKLEVRLSFSFSLFNKCPVYAGFFVPIIIEGIVLVG